MAEDARVVSATSRPIKDLPGRRLRWLAERSVGTTATAALENFLPPDGFVPSHRHEVEELLVCLEGRGEFHIDGRAHRLVGGTPLSCQHGGCTASATWATGTCTC